MRIGIVGILIIIAVAYGSCSRSQSRDQSLRTLVLNEQELKFAGSSLRTVLGSNVNSYRRNKGLRRFSGTFTIIEKDPSGTLDIRIDADVDITGPGLRYDDVPPRNRYAGQFNY